MSGTDISMLEEEGSEASNISMAIMAEGMEGKVFLTAMVIEGTNHSIDIIHRHFLVVVS